MHKFMNTLGQNNKQNNSKNTRGLHFSSSKANIGRLLVYLALTFENKVMTVYSNIMAHMPSAYGLGKNTIFNKVQFSSVQTVI